MSEAETSSSANVEAIKATVDDAASVDGGLWLSYLFTLFYLAVAAGAVTHAYLFLRKAVKLPFLTDIELPLLAFFSSPRSRSWSCTSTRSCISGC
jgi:hypothetical protein